MITSNTLETSGTPVVQDTNVPRFQGRVKWFNKRRGFGFILDVDNPDNEYFCHHSAIRPNSNCWRILHEGEYVEFSIENGKMGEQCNNVTGLRGGPLRCDFAVDRSRTGKGVGNQNPLIPLAVGEGEG